MAKLDEAVRLIGLAQKLRLPDGPVVICRHGPDEVTVLRRLGWDVDSPALHAEAAYQGPLKPFEHQLATVAFMVQNPRGYVLNGMGSGKTAASVWAMRFLRAASEAGLTSSARAALVVAPLSTIRDVWEREIRRLDIGARVQVLHGTKAKRLAALGQDAEWYIINHDGVKVIRKELQEHWLIDTVIIDESTAFKNANTDRWRAMNAIVNKTREKRRCWALTGTPMAQSVLDVYGQAKLVTPHTVPRSATMWRDMTMTQVAEHKWVPKNTYLETARAAMTPAIRIAKEDCVELPPLMHVDRLADLTKEQRAAVDALRKQWMVKKDEQQITAANAAVKMLKLLQIYQGVVLDDEQEPVMLDAKPRMELVRELIEEAEHGVIVFVPFRAVIDALSDYLGKAGIEHVIVHGGIGGKERQRRFEAFRAGEPRVLLAHPKTTSHGLSFTNASVTVWYGPITSVETYQQANQRMARPGQRHKMTIYHVSADGLETSLFKRLRKGEETQEALFDAYRALTGGGDDHEQDRSHG